MKKLQPAVLNQATTHLLRLAILVISVIVLALCSFALPEMWQAVDDEYPNHTYVFYGILSALYLGALPFFFALAQSWILLNLIDKSKAFSMRAVRSLRYIAVSGLLIAGIFTAVMPLIFIWADNDDAPGLIIFWTLLIGASLTVTVFAGVMKRVLEQAIRLKKENDLTV